MLWQPGCDRLCVILPKDEQTQRYLVYQKVFWTKVALEVLRTDWKWWEKMRTDSYFVGQHDLGFGGL